jgi:enamine deaminase RidA (YjgF/YER057c/UK114 family)
MQELDRSVVNTDKAPQPIGMYSQAIRVRPGELVFVAGQVGLDAEGVLAGPDVAAQTRAVFENIGHVLEGVGASFANVVEFTTYLVGRGSIQPFIEARTEVFPAMFPDGDYPPNTLLVIDALVRDEFLVEIKAVAALP